MIRPSPADEPSSEGLSTLAKKRRADVALTVSELHQRRRRRVDPTLPPEEGKNGKRKILTAAARTQESDRRRGGYDANLIALLKKHSIGNPVDDETAKRLLYNPFEIEHPSDAATGGRLGRSMVDHPSAVKALVRGLFLPFTSGGKVKRLETKIECGKLLARAVLASEKRVCDVYLGGDGDDGDGKDDGGARYEALGCRSNVGELAKIILNGCQLVEKVENMVSFVVTEDVSEKEWDSLSVGRQLSSLCIKHAIVAQGFLLWATEHCAGNKFAETAPYPTLAPGILGLARIIGKHHPFSRRQVMNLALIFLKHYNRDISYEKTTILKQQCLRLLLFLTTQGLAIDVFNTVDTKIRKHASSEIDFSLMRYFVGGALEIIRPPVSVPFVRSMGKMLSAKLCVDALNSQYFDTKKKIALVKLVSYFMDAVAEDMAAFSGATARDRALAAGLKGSYGAGLGMFFPTKRSKA